jgi:acyl carrier protein
MSNISERVKEIIAKHLGIDSDKVTEDDNFIDDLGADSLDTVELAMSFEDEFGCEIPDEAADSMFTVGDVIKLVCG